VYAIFPTFLKQKGCKRKKTVKNAKKRAMRFYYYGDQRRIPRDRLAIRIMFLVLLSNEHNFTRKTCKGVQ